MQITIAKLVAVAIALVQVVVVYYVSVYHLNGDGSHSLMLLGFFVFALAFIWFPEEIGDLTGWVSRGHIVDKPTPGCLLSAVGWFMLVGWVLVPLFLVWTK